THILWIAAGVLDVADNLPGPWIALAAASIRILVTIGFFSLADHLRAVVVLKIFLPDLVRTLFVFRAQLLLIDSVLRWIAGVAAAFEFLCQRPKLSLLTLLQLPLQRPLDRLCRCAFHRATADRHDQHCATERCRGLAVENRKAGPRRVCRHVRHVHAARR